MLLERIVKWWHRIVPTVADFKIGQLIKVKALIVYMDSNHTRVELSNYVKIDIPREPQHIINKTIILYCKVTAISTSRIIYVPLVPFKYQWRTYELDIDPKDILPE